MHGSFWPVERGPTPGVELARVSALAGEVFCSRNDGDDWERLAGQFPRITMLKTWVG